MQVDFGTTLDLAPYMCDRRASPQMYQLYGVLVHQGHSVHAGHYYCFVRAANGLWHQMNDNCVSQVSLPSYPLSSILLDAQHLSGQKRHSFIFH